MLSGILPVTDGKIYFDGEDVSDLPPEKREVGLVFQNYALYPHMTVLENICFPLKIKKVPKAERIERAKVMAKMVHIDDYLDRKPKELSGGQQQRVAIARALVKNPKLLLLDEPLSNLDAKLRVEMREEIRRIQRESGVTTFFVTHDQEEASSISDYIMLMKLGTMQQYDHARTLYDDPANLFVADFIGSPTINQLHGIWRNGAVEVDGCDERIVMNGVNVAEGTRVVFAARPESLERSDHGAFTGEVVESYLSGKDTLADVKVGAGHVRAYIDATVKLQEGQTLSLGLKDKGIFLFDETTGDRYV